MLCRDAVLRYAVLLSRISRQERLREEEERGRFHRQMEDGPGPCWDSLGVTWCGASLEEASCHSFGMQEEARDEEDAHEAAFWNDPLQAAI